ncbi:MAG: hypothetical protein A2W19_03535 [Spirochaetes bacterium RBG_16_49_21]|nr:MAG: hypothetical protein A2W19_03535 [Spirochaetes bacterium RBG_16_49_21]
MRKKAMPRKKSKNSRYAGFVRPYILLTDDENWLVEQERTRQKFDKGEYLRRAVLYIAKNKIDLSEK